MSTTEERLALLRRFNAQLLEGDPALAEEIRDTLPGEGFESLGPGTIQAQTTEAQTIEAQTAFESISLRRTRPVLAIKGNQTELVFADQDDVAIWKDRLTRAKAVLEPAIRAVGRIELTGHDAYEWVGTGWLVAANVMVTNRHVAVEFAGGDTLVFKPGTCGRMSADIDFLRELDSDATRVLRVTRPLYIEPAPGPDLAFFEVEQVAGSEPEAGPIKLSSGAPSPRPNVAVIGYPARDSRIPEQGLMEQIYGNRYDRKRLAPGAVTRVDATRVFHNCTTLGGNSGSVVLDLLTGEALGLHFSGSFLSTNYAVRADIVQRRLDALRAGTLRPPRVIAAPRAREHEVAAARPPRGPAAAGPASWSQGANGSVTISVPLVVTVSLGAPAGRPPAQRRVRPAVRPSAAGDDGADIATEGVVADYVNRKGYLPEFLGDDFLVELPTVVRNARDVLKFEVDGKRETVLRYEHFSVVMSASRRMCLFSAVNIDGELSKKKSKRAAWRTDPRIPRRQQILNECYGSPPKFSRGHMTRREDPAWGATAASVQRGSDDSMHVTNTVPQMQAFNSPIWLGLEDYALGSAREADAKISVFTGPYFDFDGVADPVIDGVQIPRSFWKIIAFVHDETGELCATGYEMSQENSLPQEEVVFGDFVSPQLNVSTQVSIARIEARTGLQFGDLVSFDPLGTEEEAVDGGAPPALATFEQIRFR